MRIACIAFVLFFATSGQVLGQTPGIKPAQLVLNFFNTSELPLNIQELQIHGALTGCLVQELRRELPQRITDRPWTFNVVVKTEPGTTPLPSSRFVEILAVEIRVGAVMEQLTSMELSPTTKVAAECNRIVEMMLSKARARLKSPDASPAPTKKQTLGVVQKS